MPIRSLVIAVIIIFLSAHSYSNYSAIPISKNSFLIMDDNDEAVVTIHNLAFKPRWQWMGVERIKQNELTTSATLYSYHLDKDNINWDLLVDNKDNTLSIDSTLKSSTTVPLTYISLAFDPGPSLKGGSIRYTDINGRSETIGIPIRVKNAEKIVRMDFIHANGETKLTNSFKYPVDIHFDYTARVKLVDAQISPDEIINHSIKIQTPRQLSFYRQLEDLPNDTDHSQWFTFAPKNTRKPGKIGMQDWLNKSQSPPQMTSDQFSHQQHNKIWGTNVEYIDVAPTKRNAKTRTDFFAKYGINSVRLHKLTNADWEGLGTRNSASEYDAKKLSRFDYWLSLLKKRGISYGFSPIWDLMVFEGDREKLIAYDEIVNAKPNKPVTTGLVWFAEDVQNLHIETITNLLKHKNPYTGLAYAKDPSLAYVEIQNEEDIFFYTFTPQVLKHPTYHKLLAEQFSDWLIKKYRTHESLVNAWGRQSINTFKDNGAFADEHLSKRNITPYMNPWFHDNQGTKGYRAKRLQDTARFLLEKQQQYYAKASKAIRDTGFEGMIVSSNWQAGNKGTHFLNLLSDAEIGIIDRHNYQGGAQGNPGYTMRSGFELQNYSMLGDPGSGLLSTGMQQVANVPFMFSEWLSVVPSEWAAADTSLVAIYGFGLQGWDMSYHFASNGNGFSPQLTYPNHKKFNNLTPVGVGLYPVLSRMVLRGDITESKPIAIRRLNKEQAVTNSYDFDNTVDQQHDIKSLSGTPNHNALAAGKVLIEFTQDKGVSSISPWRETYERLNKDGSKTITSTTNELKWTYTNDNKKGYVEVNSKGTQGIIGFAPNMTYQLNDMSITPQSPYSVILTTAKSPTGTLASDKEAIIVALARAHNTNMNIKGSLIANAGEAPMILEPVKATLRFKRKGTIEVLNHDGLPTGKTYPIGDNDFELNTQRDKTIYYHITFE